MVSPVTPIRRHQGYDDPKVDELARDVSEGLARILGLKWLDFRKYDATYFEPFTVGGFKEEPDAVLALRIRDLSALEEGLVHQTSCSFVWLGNGTVRMDAIEGLTEGTAYRFTFLALKAVN